MYKITHAKLLENRPDARAVRELVLKADIPADPGQFVMVGLSEGGMRPISIAGSGSGTLSLGVKAVGDFTQRLCRLDPGALVSLRGAYGSSFFMPAAGSRVLLVAGGCAAPPLCFLAERLISSGVHVDFVNGARNREELVFAERIAALGPRCVTVLDDEGGNAATAARAELASNSYDRVYAAGPEAMLAALREILAPVVDGTGRPLEYQFLMERYMKCGIGICGSCVTDPDGLRLCVEGPVLGRSAVEAMSELGQYRRDAAGRRVLFSGACGVMA